MESAVTLIVKAPYNDVADQIVKCQTSWTVRDLKGHLSSTHPSQPKSEEQRLIYSGQLLLDHLTLKDILRHNNENNTHTFHLVCTRYNTSSPPSMPVSDNNSGDGLRNRFNSTAVREESTLNRNTNELTPEQQAAYQHMYQVQEMYSAYMSQYMNYLQGNGLPSWPPINAPFGTGLQAPPMEGRNVEPQPERVPAPEVNGAALEDDDEDIRPRDWLDWVFELTRVLLLLVVVYIYSNLTRVMMVVAGFIFVYYYQRKHNDRVQDGQEVPNAPERAVVPEAPNVQQQDQEEINETERQNLITQDENVADDPSVNTPNESLAEVNTYQENIPSKFRIAITFLYSLISSVIPIPEEQLN